MGSEREVAVRVTARTAQFATNMRQASNATRTFKREVHQAGMMSGRSQQGVIALAQGVEDFNAVQGSMSQKIRATSNNLSQFLTLMAGAGGAIAAVAISLGASYVANMFEAGEETKKATDKLREFRKELDKTLAAAGKGFRFGGLDLAGIRVQRDRINRELFQARGELRRTGTRTEGERRERGEIQGRIDQYEHELRVLGRRERSIRDRNAVTEAAERRRRLASQEQRDEEIRRKARRAPALREAKQTIEAQIAAIEQRRSQAQQASVFTRGAARTASELARQSLRGIKRDEESEMKKQTEKLEELREILDRIAEELGEEAPNRVTIAGITI